MTNTALYGLGVMSVFFVMCLLDRENARQKFFLAVTFFCLQWQSLLIKSSAVNELYLLFVKIGERLQGPTNNENIFWFGSYLVQSILDLALAFLLTYGSGRLMLWAYGRKREDMKGRDLLILLVPSVSGAFAYEVIGYYNKIYERDSGKYVWDIYGYHDWLMSLYSVICFMTIFVMTYVYRQWKNEQEEDKQREVFSRQMQDLESHIAEVERLYRDMRCLRHDMGNHLMTLEQLYGRGEYEEAGKYAGELKMKVQDVSSDVSSGLPITSKSGDGHGFGLANIRHAAKKYYGDIRIGKEMCEGEERCVLRVMMQLARD